MSDRPDDLKDQINVAAYFLAQKNHPYDTLCWFLAERQLFIKNEKKKAPEDIIRNRAAEIYVSTCPYDILCWLISELDILIVHKRYDLIPNF